MNVCFLELFFTMALFEELVLIFNCIFYSFSIQNQVLLFKFLKSLLDPRYVNKI